MNIKKYYIFLPIICLYFSIPHNNSAMENGPKRNKVNAQYTCSDCGKNFYRGHYLATHHKLGYKCTICSPEVIILCQQGYERHWRTHHRDIKEITYGCKYCGEPFE